MTKKEAQKIYESLNPQQRNAVHVARRHDNCLTHSPGSGWTEGVHGRTVRALRVRGVFLGAANSLVQRLDPGFRRISIGKEMPL